MENNEEIVQSSIREADSVIKIICAIMNEEESVDAYEEKTPEEMVELLQSINNRFPNNDQASVDPAYLKFGQACLNGYYTFGIDFFKQLAKRTDSTQSLCYKGLIDMYTSMVIQNQQLALSMLPEDERLAIEKDLTNEESLSDEDFLNKYTEKEVE
jgi:hypothetical protein